MNCSDRNQNSLYFWIYTSLLKGLMENVVVAHFTLLHRTDYYISFILAGIKIIFAVTVSQYYYGNNHVAIFPTVVERRIGVLVPLAGQYFISFYLFCDVHFEVIRNKSGHANLEMYRPFSNFCLYSI
jgi:hypothetical protein